MRNFAQKLSRAITVSSLGKPYYRKQDLLTKFFKMHSLSDKGVALDLGSGPNPRNPFSALEVYGVDIRSQGDNNVFAADVSRERLPFSDETFDVITAFDVLEHIPRIAINSDRTKFPFVSLMNEIFRVIKYRGIFFSIHPCFPFKEAFQDPTHVNIMTEDTMNLYFCERAWARIYGYEGSFSMVSEGWQGYKYFSFILKNSREKVLDLNFAQK